MRKLITTKHSEFAQNGENMALIKTEMPGSKPIMISTSTFMEALKNSNEEVTEMLGLQADEYYIKPIVQSGDTVGKIILKTPPITITSYLELFSNKSTEAAESLIQSVTKWADGSLEKLCYENSSITELKLDAARVNIDTTSLNNAFYYCREIKRIDLSGVHNSGAFTVLKAFTDCYALELLDVRNLDWTLATAPNAFQNMSGAPFRSVPTTCKIIVGTDADKERLLTTATIGATKLNIMTVAEYEASLEV
jgi:hypothetical protein